MYLNTTTSVLRFLAFSSLIEHQQHHNEHQRPTTHTISQPAPRSHSPNPSNLPTAVHRIKSTIKKRSSWNGKANGIEVERLAIESPASCTSDVEDHMSPGQSSTVAAVSQSSAACCDEDTFPDSCICSTRLPSALSGYDFVPQKQLNVADASKSSMSSNASVKVEMDSRDDRTMTSSRDSSRGVDCCYEEGPEVKYEMSHNDDDNLDTMVLRR
ncbi:hypothetical protein Droror1_Dr00001374 [Drosera rotundifolia]